jgi:hypothetical protein
LKDAPGGNRYLTEDPATVQRGKVVFAERCARCHSSTVPQLPAGLDLENANGPDYLRHWNDYWAWSKTDDFKSQMRAIVLKEDFLKDNYLSTELRVPITLLQINACSPIATNAIAGNVWDNFSSASYKSLPSVGSIKVRHPVTGAESDFVVPGGGRGFIRPASLVSAWSTGPFLQNNTVGPFDPSPSVEARMRVFQESIQQMLWPERRAKDPIFANDNGAGVGVIDRLTNDSFVEIAEGYVPDYLRPLVGAGRRLFPFLFSEGSVKIGPLPKGTPIGLLANMDLLGADLKSDEERRAHRKKLLDLIKRAKRELKNSKDLGVVLGRLTDPMLEMSKCRDFVVNKGHYFGTDFMRAEEPGLGDSDKNALIAFVKNF